MKLDGRFTLNVFLVFLFFYFVGSSDETVVDVKGESKPSTPFLNRMDEGGQFLLRKCCEVGQGYTQNSTINKGGSLHCVDYRTARHRDSTFIEISQQLLFAHQNRSDVEESNFKLDLGLPRDCSSSGLAVIEPELIPTDRFYPLESGFLVVPHRFWFFQPKHHCMEDFFLDDDFNQVKRSAIICTERIEYFPASAVDHQGRLNFDFLPGMEKSSALLALRGRRVIRKCCDLNEVYSMTNRTCIAKQSYATHYFDDLKIKSKNEEDLFFQIGLLDCLEQLQTTIFTINQETGGLQIKMKESDENWQEVTKYCLEDFVVFFEDNSPETTNLASFCPPRYPNLNPSVDSAIERGLSVPKCCPAGHIVEGDQCQPLKIGGKVNIAISETALLEAIQTFSEVNVTTGVLTPNVTLSCGLVTPFPLLSPDSYAFVTPSFKDNGNGSVSFVFHFYVAQYWDMNVTLKPFCLDLELSKTDEGVYYVPTVWYCASSTQVSGHYPILLYISSAALVATFIIYFFVPASGGARFVTSPGGGGKPMGMKGRPAPMAIMLTGLNLLCHIFCLSVTFIALAIGQQDVAVPGEGSCTALGYVIYVASMGSFTWLTVFCFDYCWMFRGSFNVSDRFIFVPYSVFGWGVPILTLTFAVLAQFGTRLVHFLPDVNPNMGLIRCWFAGQTSALVFFYIPVSLLLTLNIAFFLRLLFNSNLMNCTKSCVEKNSSSGPQLRINRKGTSSSRNQEDLKKAVKLFFIAGIPWVLEIVAWLPSYFPTGISSRWRQNTVYLFEVSNTLNALRGVTVFILFVLLQRDVRRHLWHWLKKFCSGSPKPSEPGAEIQSQPSGSSSQTSRKTSETQLTPTPTSDISEPVFYISGGGDADHSTPNNVEVDYTNRV